MGHREWDALPGGVRHAVELRCGPVLKAETAGAGINSAVATILCLKDGKVFCKGIHTEDRAIRMHRNEARVNPWLPAVAPGLLWQIEADGWLLLGFEYIEGKPANLAPGSPDLDRVANVLTDLQRELTPAPDVPLQLLATRWAKLPAWRTFLASPPANLDGWALANLELLAEWESAGQRLVGGETLLHTDLNQNNILIADSVHVIDWAWACQGAAWVDVAFLVLRLMTSGHHPQDAEKWAHRMPSWHAADDLSVTAFAVTVAGLWEHRTRTAPPAPHRAKLTVAAREWARYRLGDPPLSP